MRKLFVATLALVFAVCLASATIASASDVPEPFPSVGDNYCSATNGCGTLPAGGMTAFMWTTGDYVQSPVFNTGQSSINSLSYDFMVYDVLGGGNNETVGYFVNGTEVGSIVVPDCNYCGQNMEFSGTFSFGSIGEQGGGFQLEMILQNTIPPGGGSIAFDDGGSATLSGGSATTPEPGSIVLFGSGLLGLAGILRRKIGL
ncbi:MAG: PEP-CTERM sorting domain-containing protein [Candidatus Korobacteraceae bacterium]